MIIYLCRNLVDNKVYIGQTTRSLTIRRKEHIKDTEAGEDYYLHKALRKYGFDNFEWTVLRICDNIESLNVFEQYFILYYNSLNRMYGYNLQSGGLNGFHSDESKQKISDSLQGHSCSKATKAKIRKTLTGRKRGKYKYSDGKNYKHSVETRLKISKSLIGRAGTKGKNNGFYGKKHTKETRLKMSVAIKAHWEKRRK